MRTEAPELIEDDEEDYHTVAQTPDELRKQIAELQERLKAAEPPEELVTVNVPYDATGNAPMINGRKYHGRMTITRAEANQLASMLSINKFIEAERLQPRGNLISKEDLAMADATSQIVAARRPREL